jgi:hypothetical protein
MNDLRKILLCAVCKECTAALVLPCPVWQPLYCGDGHVCCSCGGGVAQAAGAAAAAAGGRTSLTIDKQRQRLQRRWRQWSVMFCRLLLCLLMPRGQQQQQCQLHPYNTGATTDRTADVPNNWCALCDVVCLQCTLVCNDYAGRGCASQGPPQCMCRR